MLILIFIPVVFSTFSANQCNTTEWVSNVTPAGGVLAGSYKKTKTSDRNKCMTACCNLNGLSEEEKENENDVFAYHKSDPVKCNLVWLIGSNCFMIKVDQSHPAKSWPVTRKIDITAGIEKSAMLNVTYLPPDEEEDEESTIENPTPESKSEELTPKFYERDYLSIEPEKLTIFDANAGKHSVKEMPKKFKDMMQAESFLTYSEPNVIVDPMKNFMKNLNDDQMVDLEKLMKLENWTFSYQQAENNPSLNLNMEYTLEKGVCTISGFKTSGKYGFILIFS